MTKQTVEVEKVRIRDLFESLMNLSVGSALLLLGVLTAVATTAFSLGDGFNRDLRKELLQQTNKGEALMALVAHYAALVEKLQDRDLPLDDIDFTIDRFNKVIERINARVHYYEDGALIVKGQGEGYVVFGDDSKVDLPPLLFVGGNAANPGHPEAPEPPRKNETIPED